MTETATNSSTISPVVESRLLRIVVLTLIAALIVWLALWMLIPPPNLGNAKQVALELRSVIYNIPQFSEVIVTAMTNAHISVMAPDSLPPAAKTELERLVSEHARGHQTRVGYLVPISETQKQ